jgi:hypothetical protein
MGPAVTSGTYGGWNLDEVTVGGVRTSRPPDSNGDGQPDEWLIYHFGSTNAPRSGASEDWDLDGVSNLDEYLAGTDPTNQSDRLEVTLRFFGGQAVITCPMKALGPFHTGWNRLYALESCSNLVSGSWAGVPSCTNIPASAGTVSYTNSAPSATGLYRARMRLE